MSTQSIYSKFPALNSFLSSQNLNVLDIGGRGGPIDDLKGFSHISNLIIVEPELAERTKLQESPALLKEWKTLTFIDTILAEKKQDYTLNICKQPGLSSLLSPNLNIIDQYYTDNSDWLVVNSQQLPGDTLKSQLLRRNLIDKLDVIKLDTQGSELSILRSLGKDLLSSLTLLYVESEIQQFYEGQPLFNELHDFLCSHGFILVDLKKTKIRRHSDLNLAFSKQECVWFHLCYINNNIDSAKELKLISSLIAAGYLDYAAKSITKSTYLTAQDKNLILDDLERFSQSQFRKNKLRTLKSIIKQVMRILFSSSTKVYSQDKWVDEKLL